MLLKHSKSNGSADGIDAHIMSKLVAYCSDQVNHIKLKYLFSVCNVAHNYILAFLRMEKNAGRAWQNRCL